MRSEPAHSPLTARPSDSEDVQRAFVEYSLREALGAVIAPDTHDMVIALALDRSGRGSLPARANEVEGFVASSFHQAIEEVFGLNVADAAVEEVRGILPSAFDPTQLRTPYDSGAFPSGSHDAPTPLVPAGRDYAAHLDDGRAEPITVRVADPGSFDAGSLDASSLNEGPLSIFDQGTRPMPAPAANNRATSKLSTVRAAARNETVLFIVTDQDEVYGAIAIELDPGTAVVRTRGVTALLQALDADGIEPFIVIDARNRTGVLGLEQLSKRLPRDTRMLLWGDEAEVRSAMPLLAHRPEWVLCDPEAELEDVSAMVGVLMGR